MGHHLVGVGNAFWQHLHVGTLCWDLTWKKTIQKLGATTRSWNLVFFFCGLRNMYRRYYHHYHQTSWTNINLSTQTWTSRTWTASATIESPQNPQREVAANLHLGWELVGKRCCGKNTSSNYPGVTTLWSILLMIIISYHMIWSYHIIIFYDHNWRIDVSTKK